VGGCDLYTIKPAGGEKKLYKQIDRSLEAQHESLVRLAASLSPPEAKHFAKTSNLAQSSPFGALSQASSRRTYAHMIATLNASHPDYDFSHVLRPADFRREKRLRDVMHEVDSKVYAASSSTGPRGAQTPGGSMLWSPRMWDMMDAEMDLYSCEIYSYKPEENPFDDEELALWSLHYFFFNKTLRRVCYLNLRALSPTWQGSDDEAQEDDDVSTQASTITPARPKRSYSARQSVDFSARKRARFWLGDKADALEDWDGSEATALYDDDDVDVDVELLDEIVKRGRSMSSHSMSTQPSEDVELDGERGIGHVRSLSQGVAESIEL
jgi:hypothetical protein